MPDENNLFPEIYAKDYVIDGNSARQLIYSQASYEIEVRNGTQYARTVNGVYELVNPNATAGDNNLAIQLQSTYRPNERPDLQSPQFINLQNLDDASAVLASLENKFTYKESTTTQDGLRAPQIGALHSVMGYWTTADKSPVTVVMPTGTGKTETMLSLFAAHRPKRLLILVPTDALRKQIGDKFQNYGILKSLGVIDGSVKNPVVGRVEHGFSNVLNARGFAQSCNVIIATPNALSESPENVWKALVKECSHLFIDEAHHISAPTWKRIKDEFIGRSVVQFTATPFREDGERLGGKLLYNYPLREAQKAGYFSKIKYVSVIDFDDTHGAIADEAIKRLKEDLDNNLDHQMMARVKTVKKAQAILDLYTEKAPELNPVIVYGNQPIEQKRTSMRKLMSKESKIVVCVDMLGEGFDLPSLKIAAIHEPHKSLGITLQFVGRFARSGSENIGEATVVVSRGDPQHDMRLRELYSEDPDWNVILSDLSSNAVGEQEQLNEFEQGFNNQPEDISLQNISPKMSTVVYKVQSDEWHPERLQDKFKDTLLTYPIPVNTQENVAWFVTKNVIGVPWGDVKYVEETLYELYVVYFDKAKHLLYINCSSNDGVYLELAKLVCGDSIEIIKNTTVYRTMASLKRRVPTNVGVLDTRNRNARFEMISGYNVDDAFTDANRRNKTQTNIFAYGYDEKSGARLSIGASTKGRIWSHRAAVNVRAWMKWCDYVGSKLTDTNIDPDDVMKGFIVPTPLEARPSLVPIGIEWASESFYTISESITLNYQNEEIALIDTEPNVTSYEASGNIKFEIPFENVNAQYEIVMSNGEFSYVPLNGEAIIVTAHNRIPLSEYFKKHGLRVIFEKETIVEPNMIMVQPKSLAPAYNKDKLVTIDWSGTNIRMETQGVGRDASSIQAKMIEYISSLDSWDLIVDDDGSGEIADIVAVKVVGDKLKVALVHCKFSSSSSPGTRLADLYEVCGQAQKSIIRRLHPENMMQTLVRREKTRRLNGRNNIMHGSDETLQEIYEKASILIPEFSIYIAQPGVSKRQIRDNLLELLGATESYISDVGGQTSFIAIVNE